MKQGPWRLRWQRWGLGGVCLALLMVLGACSTTTRVGYYWQSFTGHLAVIQATRPVADWLADDATAPELKERLRLAQGIRTFAVQQLALPNNASYTRYADLKRRAAVWNVVAAPPYSLQLHQWCFPVVGCVGYRAYFDEADAKAFAREFQAQQGSDWEVAVYGVSAYSTLGWSNWLGGDPLLNTFMGLPDGELARLVFHEMAHQVVYVADDMVFNESFATAVARLGGQRWLDGQASAEARRDYANFDHRRQQLRDLVYATRERLAAVYAQDTNADPNAASNADKETQKQAVMADFKNRYQTLKTEWGGDDSYDAWVAKANNAWFATQCAYNQWVPHLEALFEREGRDFPRFYAAVKQLAEWPQGEREKALKEALAR